MSKYIPGFETASPLDALTTIIHQTGIIHGVDHLSLYDQFSKDFGCTSMRVPFYPINDNFWKSRKYPINQILNNPESVLINSSDVLRTKIFANTFENFLPGGHKHHSMMLLDTDYKNLDKNIVKKFKEDLIELDAELFGVAHRMMPKLDSDCLKTREMRPAGLRLIGVDKMIRSVCM